MRKLLLAASGLGLVFSAAGAALAQNMPSGPPKILVLIREEVKSGKGAAHSKFEANYVAAFRKAKSPTYYLAMTSMSGSSEAWFAVPYASMEAWEKDNQWVDKSPALAGELDQLGARDAEYISGARTVVLEYREDLSYRAGSTDIAKARYFDIETVRVRLGWAKPFADTEKMAIEAHQRANSTAHWACYEVASGMPANTFLFFTSVASLKEMDDESNDKKVNDALGEEGMNRRRQFARDGLISASGDLYSLSPGMSYVDDATASRDPGFWKPKMAAPAKSGAAMEKPAGTAPAKKAPSKTPSKQ